MTTWKPDICIYHGGCEDGFGAAWAVWMKWGDEVVYVPGSYGKPIPDVTGKHVLFVDFSLKADAMYALANKARTIVVLDHHKTAEEELRPFIIADYGRGLHAMLTEMADLLQAQQKAGLPPVVAVFDMEKSGARLAWEFCDHRHPEDLPPLMISYIEDRDLWRFAFGDQTRRFSAALRTYPQDFALWTDIAGRTGDLLNEGASILRGHQKIVEECCQHAYEQMIAGHVVPVVNVPGHFASDCAHHLLLTWPDAPFAAAWFQGGEGHQHFSLRSTNERLDVSEIAASLGGGGHRNAAGFRARLSAPHLGARVNVAAHGSGQS